jgi:hypothetical protein
LAAALVVAVSVTSVTAEDFSSLKGAPKWKAWNYNRVLAHPAVVASPGANGIEFPFLDRPDNAFLLTNHPSYRGDLLGDLTGKTLSATVGVSVTSGSDFTYYGETDACGTQPSVRLYLETDTSGDFQDTDYWWSNPVSVTLDALVSGDFTLSALLDPALWSHWNGKFGNHDAATTAAFYAAVKDVKYVGLSFGGGCFFANGVGITAGTGEGKFLLREFEAN